MGDDDETFRLVAFRLLTELWLKVGTPGGFHFRRSLWLPFFSMTYTPKTASTPSQCVNIFLPFVVLITHQVGHKARLEPQPTGTGYHVARNGLSYCSMLMRFPCFLWFTPLRPALPPSDSSYSFRPDADPVPPVVVLH